MPAALDFSTWVKVSPLENRKLQIYSENFNEESKLISTIEISPRVDTGAITRSASQSCSNARVIVCAARDCEIRGEVPIGSGLSSSAAIEVATACALVANSGFGDRSSRARAACASRAENEFVGARVGIMDQFVSLFGQAHKALLLDCRSLEFRLLPLPDNVRLIICNTMVKHELASSAYNERRAQCEAGVKHLAQFFRM